MILRLLIDHWPMFLALAILAVAAGFNSSRTARLRADCATHGHQWVPPGMGDHPDASCVCNRCGLEW
jgi:hypothetical protein